MIYLFFFLIPKKVSKLSVLKTLTLQGCFFFSFFLSDQKMDVRSMKAFKDGEFDSVLDKGKTNFKIIFSYLKTNLVADKLISALQYVI